MKRIVISKNKLYNLYVIKEKSIEEISILLKISFSIIRRNLKKYSIPIRPKFKRSLFRNIFTRNYLIEEYINKKRSTKSIAEPFNVGKIVVLKALKKHKILTRTPSEYGKLKIHFSNKIKVNCAFCNEELEVWKSDLKNKKHKFCSRLCRAKFRVGNRAANWQNGKSFEEYGKEFDGSLKEQVRFRDKYKCQLCGCSQLENGRQLDCHHKDYNKRNNNINNLISLCVSCHLKTNGNRNYWIEFFNKRDKTGVFDLLYTNQNT